MECSDLTGNSWLKRLFLDEIVQNFSEVVFATGDEIFKYKKEMLVEIMREFALYEKISSQMRKAVIDG